MRWDRLARLWKLGSELESTSFKDAIVDATVCKATSTGKYPDRLPELFGGYLQHISGMRRLLVDISVAHRLDPTFRRSSSNPQCQLFYYDCSNAVDNLRGVEDSVCKAQQRLHLEEIFGTCWYHEHTHTAACYKVVCPAKSGHLRCKQSEIQECVYLWFNEDYRGADFPFRVGTTIAAISVASGATQKLFFVHTELISRNSDYLAAALSPRWNHSVETIEMIGLPGETRPSVFRAFLRFLATGRIELDSEDLKAPAHDQDSAGMLKLDLSLMFLGHLWILGDQIGSTSLRDAVTDKLMASLRIEGRLPLQLYPLVYRCSERPSGVRQLLVDAAVHLWNEGTITHAPREGAEDFFVELAAALMKRCKAGPLIAPFDRSEVGCRYHDHGDAEPCYKTAFASPDSSTKQSTDLSLLWPW